MEMTCDHRDCTACYSCLLSCRFNAIEMKENKYGYMLPYIDPSKCVDCGKCKTVCHVCKDVPKNKILKVYAGISTNQEIYHESSSGGFATSLAYYILNVGGVVYGAAFDENFKLRHIRVDKRSDLEKLQGSKYTESDLGEIYRSVKDDISERKVLFTGTPCQVAGLLAYLGKREKDNLLTLSFICGGIASSKFMHESIKVNVREVTKIIFRKGEKAGIWIKYKNNKEKYLSRYLSPYLIGYYHKLLQRLCCFNCKYSSLERVGDITVGDFWGLKKGKFVDKNTTGVSVVMPTTNKGQDYLMRLSSDFKLEEHELEEVITHNQRLLTPSHYNNSTRMFRKLYPVFGLNSSVRVSIGIGYWYKTAKMYIKHGLKFILFYN